MKRPTNTILFALTAMLLCASSFQKQTNLFKFKDLRGVVVEKTMPKLTFENYRDGLFQQQTEEHLKQHFGYRQPLIRFYNQYLWDFYKKTNVSKEQIIFGKDNWIFEPGVVSDYYQRQFRFFAADSTEMASMLSKEAHRLLRLQQVLESHGIRLIVCLMPTKDLLCSEHLPEIQDTTYIGEPKISARFFNEEEFTRIGVNHLNLEQWFLQIKDTADFALFPKTGTHWTRYAALYAADTLIRYMEHLNNINMKNLVIGPRELDNARKPDDDLESLLNLIRPLPKPKYYYADCTTDGDTTAIKPKMIVIGDSFWWTIAAQIPLKEIFSEAPYWYYNSTVYYDDRYHSVDELNLNEELHSSDFVVLSYCAAQQYRMNDGFSQKALEALGINDGDAFMDSAAFIEREIQRNIGKILATPSSMKNIREKATQNNQPVEQAVRDNARWIVSREIQQGILKWPDSKYINVLDSTAFIEQEIQIIMDKLSANPETMESIREKAAKSNKTIKKALYDDAHWIVNHQTEQGTLKWPGTTQDTNTKTKYHGIQ
jgi:hypothetical protein